MRFWLLAPVTRASRPEPVELTRKAGSVLLRNSASDRTHYLSIMTEQIDSTGIPLFTRAERHAVGGTHYVSAVAEFPPLLADPSSSQKRVMLEESCTRGIESIVEREFGSEFQALWINRTIVVDDPLEHAVHWVNGGSTEIRFGHGEDAPADVLLSWANNAISSAAFDDSLNGPAFRAGMIHAQVVWCDIEQIADQAERLVEMQLDDQNAVRVGDGRTEALTTTFARHNLLFDDVAINATKATSAIALGALDAWGYGRFMERLDTRIRDADALERRRQLRREAKHEARVAHVLLILSLVSAAQLTLAVLALAYSGDVSVFPGDRAWSTMEVLRHVDVDVWLLLTVVVVAGIYAGLTLRRKGQP
ncbi:hypothetical protein ACXET9_08405 [Brachybacterium sp. DNPG3]